MPSLTWDIAKDSRFFCPQEARGKEVAELWESDGNVLEQRWTEVPSPDSVSVGEVNVSSRKDNIYPVPWVVMRVLWQRHTETSLISPN